MQNSILLIDEIGLERFTFGKLAKKIESTEASIYRYFENKHLLFVYLLNWYWEWMKFRIDYNTMNIEDPIKRLEITLNVIVDTARRDASVDFIDEDILHQIVVSEGTKGYHTKAVDEENKDGYFLSYKTLCLKIAENILAINPTFKYPRSLASTLIETANNSIYFAKHLPRLTDIKASSPDFTDHVIDLLKNLAFGTIHKNQKNGMPVENGRSISIEN
ncbi:MAG: TetR/AcrR family transcriptional regulator [Bacteroidota bacterium]